MMRIIPVRTLVIDDEDQVCRKISAWLSAAAYDAVTFLDPAAGIEYARRVPCQVALVDLRLPNADGPTVIRDLRAAAPHTRIIAMSAFPDAAQTVAAVRAGARDLLEKPIQQPTLLEALERQLREAGLGVRSEAEFNRRLGACLRAARTRLDRTLADVADAAGLTAAQLSQIELGKSATSTWTLARLCGALETPLSNLLANL